jgi:hypothetical protein
MPICRVCQNGVRRARLQILDGYFMHDQCALTYVENLVCMDRPPKDWVCVGCSATETGACVTVSDAYWHPECLKAHVENYAQVPREWRPIIPDIILKRV